MTKHEKMEKAKLDHKYALERINELERELYKMRMTSNDRLRALKKLDPATYGEIKQQLRGGYNKDEPMWHITSMNSR